MVKRWMTYSRKTEDELASVLDEVLLTLNLRERRVLQLRFGLEDGRSRTLEEVGREFGLTAQRVYQIEAKALRKLRHPRRWERIQDTLERETAAKSTIELVDVIEATKVLTPHLINYLKEHKTELQRLPWEVFEHLIAEFLTSWGYQDVRLVGRDPNTAADIYAVTKADPSGIPIRYFIEVKRAKAPIGVTVINAVYGAFMQERPAIGWHVAMVVSLAGFRDFARTTHQELALMGVELRDYDTIKMWLSDYRPSDKGLWLPNPLRNLP